MKKIFFSAIILLLLAACGNAGTGNAGKAKGRNPGGAGRLPDKGVGAGTSGTGTLDEDTLSTRNTAEQKKK